MNTSNTSRPVACITGASSGLGAAFATVLAKQGYHLILMARRLERLNALKSKLNCPCDLIQVDLAQTDQVEQAIQKLPSTIDLLICNAGYRIKDPFEQSAFTEVHTQIHAMILAHNRLIHHCLPKFLAQKSGKIIMVSSIAGLLIKPGPLYGPIKAYQHQQALDIHATYHRQGIQCMSLCPGLVRTEFHSVNDLNDWNHIASRWWMDPLKVAEQTLRHLQRKKTFFIPGWYNRLLYMSLRHFPIQMQQMMVKWVF